MTMTRDDLMKGAWYALEQCGLLLRDAVTLHKAGAHSSAVALAMFAREELGRHEILLDFWKAVSAGRTVAADEVRSACEEHIEKQARGQLSVVYRTDRSSRLGTLFDAARPSKSSPLSPEYKAARAEVKRLDKTKEKRTPGDRHAARLSALYMDLNETGAWSRPCEAFSAEGSADIVSDAVNDYRARYDEENRRGHFPEFSEALEGWGDRPRLPEPTNPDVRSLGLM
jgi:AbiV family abortive infection protein